MDRDTVSTGFGPRASGRGGRATGNADRGLPAKTAVECSGPSAGFAVVDATFVTAVRSEPFVLFNTKGFRHRTLENEQYFGDFM